MTKVIKSNIGHIDKCVSDIILKTIPFWKSVGFNANMITTLSLISSCLSVYYFYKKNAALSVLFLVFRWYCDFADGIYARTYNNITKFGDYYDHIVDLMFSLGIFLVFIFTKYKNPYTKYILISIQIVFFILFSMHMTCIEKVYNDEINQNRSESSKQTSFIGNLSGVCPDKYSGILRYFDNSVLYICIIILIIVCCTCDL